MFFIVRGKFVLEGWWTVDADNAEQAKQLLKDSLPSDMWVEESETTTAPLGELIVDRFQA